MNASFLPRSSSAAIAALLLCACGADADAPSASRSGSGRAAAAGTGGCAPVIDALQKAIARSHLAQHEVDDDSGRLLPPLMTRIGDRVWVDAGIGDIEEQTRDDSEQAMVDAIADGARAGQVRCQALGADTVRGTPATRYRFRNPRSPDSHNPWTLWIADGSGLPLQHAVELHFEPFDGAPMTVAWVFDGVEPPAPGPNQGFLDRLGESIERLEAGQSAAAPP